MTADEGTENATPIDADAADELPPWARKLLDWLYRPLVRWVRVPAGLLLVVAGVIGFLPVLGFWMVPLGLLLLAQDLPFLRKPIGRLLRWVHRKLPARSTGRDTSTTTSSGRRAGG